MQGKPRPEGVKNDLSVAVITLNEEKNLDRCLQSVKGLATEIVVIDSGSSDGTRKTAEKYGAVFEFRKWTGHVDQKNHALKKCSCKWVLSLDADECLSDELRAEIRRKLDSDALDDCNGYYLNRCTYYLGKWIRHAWYPEWRLRLVKRELARWEGTNPHDRLSVEGRTSRLKDGDFLHYSYRDLRHHFEVSLNYARIGAEADIEKGRRFRPLKFFGSPLGRLFKFLFLKMAWRDGWRGWIITGSAVMTAFMKQCYLLENFLARRSENN